MVACAAGLTLSLFPLLLFGVLDFVGFLWAIVAIRILMVSLYGAASFQFARTGRPVLEKPLWWRQSAETRGGGREQQNDAGPGRSADKARFDDETSRSQNVSSWGLIGHE